MKRPTRIIAVIFLIAASGCGAQRCGEDPVPETVAAGSNQTCAVTQSGTVRCWGLLDAEKQPTPVPRTNIDTARDVAMGGGLHTCVVLEDGTARCWGKDAHGELGDGKPMPDERLSPVRVRQLNSAVAITAGENSSCARSESGELWCWGEHPGHPVLAGDAALRPSPVAIEELDEVRAASTGWRNTCAAVDDGRLFCWGNNESGVLGNGNHGTTARSPEPVRVRGLDSVVDVSVGLDFACAVVEEGEVYCWGENRKGRLGTGDLEEEAIQSTPLRVSSIVSAVAVDTGDTHACALLDRGQVRCWGDNEHGQLGSDTGGPNAGSVAVESITSARAIALGDNHSCALVEDDELRCWGFNFHGQLGNGEKGDYSGGPEPVTVEF